MKKVFYSFVALALTATFVSCNNDDHEPGFSDQNIETRAAALGFDNVETYKSSVAEQCAAGNHENCDILNNGTHQVCTYADHSGTKHDGTHHNGSDHGNHDENGHSHNKGGHH